MITEAEKQVLSFIKRSLIGKEISSNFGGQAGRDVENLLEELGVNINRAEIIDCPVLGWEVKSRRQGSTSAQTVGTMYADDIISTPYKLSKIYLKIQKQLRFTQNEDNIIVDIDLIDFDQNHIQDRLEQAYESQRAKLIQNPKLKYTPVDKRQCAYFECTKDTGALDFRITETTMNNLIHSSKSTYQQLFEEC